MNRLSRILCAVSLIVSLAYAPPSQASDSKADTPQPLEQAVQTLAETKGGVPLRPVGSGLLKWFGFSVYRITLWTEGQAWAKGEVHAIQQKFLRDADAETLLSESVDVLKSIQPGKSNPTLAEKWSQQMAKFFPSLKKGDTLVTLILPGEKAAFFVNGNPIGEVIDSQFPNAFSGMWLYQDTPWPNLRGELLKK